MPRIKSKKTYVRTLGKYIDLHRCRRTGIAWVEDGTTGCGHSAHPNIDASGSVAGMKKLGYWAKDARTVKSHGFIYNIDRLVADTHFDQAAAEACRCVACSERRLADQKTSTTTKGD